MRSSTFTRGTAFAVIAALTAACADAPTAPDGPAGPAFDYSIGFDAGHAGGQVRVCKIGSDASFNVTGVGAAVPVTDGSCVTVASGFGTPQQFVTVTETVPANTTLDSIVKITGIFGANGGALVVNASSPDTTTITGTNSASAGYGLEWGTVLIFYNTFTPPPPPPGGGEGCTPGYWKQAHHWDSWVGYAPGDLFSSVFENAFPGMTLQEVLAQGGGGLNALGRHTVAALLNASSSVDYDLSVADVINQFNAVYPGGDYETLKNTLAGYNEQGCPLN